MNGGVDEPISQSINQSISQSLHLFVCCGVGRCTRACIVCSLSPLLPAWGRWQQAECNERHPNFLGQDFKVARLQKLALDVVTDQTEIRHHLPPRAAYVCACQWDGVVPGGRGLGVGGMKGAGGHGLPSCILRSRDEGSCSIWKEGKRGCGWMNGESARQACQRIQG